MIAQAKKNSWSGLLTFQWPVQRGQPPLKTGLISTIEQSSSVLANTNGQNDDTEIKKEINMLWTIFVVLLILWLLGFSLHIAGGLIHLLLVVAVIVLVINLLSGRRTAV
jgi:hypothetical protein